MAARAACDLLMVAAGAGFGPSTLAVSPSGTSWPSSSGSIAAGFGCFAARGRPMLMLRGGVMSRRPYVTRTIAAPPLHGYTTGLKHIHRPQGPNMVANIFLAILIGLMIIRDGTQATRHRRPF